MKYLQIRYSCFTICFHEMFSLWLIAETILLVEYASIFNLLMLNFINDAMCTCWKCQVYLCSVVMSQVS